MPLQLSYHGQTAIPVEVEGLVPQRVRSMPLAEIEKFPIFHGNEKLPLAEFFRVTGNPDDGRMEFTGSLAGVHWIGAHLAEGSIRVDGSAGRHLGSEMTGGEIHVSGDAGDWVGGEMHGGLIHVRGRAGHLIGAAYRGSRRGMTGGTILIGGDVGNEIGHTMRRGLLAVGGDCGDFAGINMIAGTILICGSPGIRTGAGMRRGTIGLLGAATPKLLPTFRAGGVDRPLVLELLFRELERLGFAVAEPLRNASFRTHHGDRVGVGRGEILVPVPAGQGYGSE
jgi:formylmethanofuran dehydrogenase subunit C